MGGDVAVTEHDTSDLGHGYVVTDAFFGAPYVDVDEERSEPRPHRYVHGGFEGTDTRFALHFPPPEGYRERFMHCIGGGRGGSELSAMSPAGMFGGGFDLAFDNEAYLVDSNQGHIGADELCPKAGDDSSIYGYRASAETARFARHAATRIYGAAPRYGYLFGGSGGANRAISCLEQVSGLWDGAVIGNGFGNMRNSFRTGSASFGAGRVLGDKLRDVADAMDVGGSGDPFVGLTTAQRDRLADVYRLGYPRGAEATMAGDIGIATWTLLVEELMQRDPEYFRAYWRSRATAATTSSATRCSTRRRRSRASTRRRSSSSGQKVRTRSRCACVRRTRRSASRSSPRSRPGGTRSRSRCRAGPRRAGCCRAAA